MNSADRYIAYHAQEASRVYPKNWRETGHMRKDFTPAQKRRMEKKRMRLLSRSVSRWGQASITKVSRDS